MENHNSDGVACPFGNGLQTFYASKSFIKEGHGGKIQWTTKLNMQVFYCCQINFNSGIGN